MKGRDDLAGRIGKTAEAGSCHCFTDTTRETSSLVATLTCVPPPAGLNVTASSRWVLPKQILRIDRIDFETRPPCRLITLPVKLAMMQTTNRNRELVADLATQRPRLCKAQMMCIGRFAAAYDTGLLGYELEVILVPEANGLAGGTDAAGFFGSNQRGHGSFGTGRGWLCCRETLDAIRSASSGRHRQMAPRRRSPLAGPGVGGRQCSGGSFQVEVRAWSAD